ncbi:MAG: hypothetical protein IJM77_02745, partial [Spirochaetia bacterium]|nr:hypothetical protein [Spirochaetia bacterium]
KDSDQAFQFMVNQFGFTDFPLVTAQQIVKAATVFANHGIMGDNEVEVISPEVADKMFASLDREKPADMDEYAVVKHKDVNVISSLSFYPAEDPKYIMYVVVLKPTKLLSSP